MMLCLALAASACATGPVDRSPPEGFADDPRLGERVDRICFGRSINGFGETTSETIVLEARVNDHYLVETFGPCQDLDWAQSVALDQFSSCITTADSIIPSRSAFGFDRSGIPPQACRIKAIYEWNPDAEADEAESAQDGEAAR
jgi:hypothetical protein